MFYVQTRSDFKAQVKTDLLSTELSRENSVVLEENCFLFFLFSLSLSLPPPPPCSGRSWSENGADSASSEPVCGGSLATEGVRTALAQLLNFHGINVNGLEKTIGRHQTQSNGGKWY